MPIEEAMRLRRNLVLLVLGALGSGCLASRYVHDPGYSVVHLAGSSVVYYDLRQDRPSLLWPFDFDGGTTTHLGGCRVDVDKREAALVGGLRVYSGARYDRQGRRFELCPGHVHCFERGRAPRMLARGGGFVQNLALVVDGEATWLFWIEHADDGSHAVFRMDIATEGTAHLPLPDGFVHRAEVGHETLSAQNGSVVYVVETQRSPPRHRTWRGDFATRSWADPIDGSFRVIDAHGTLLERRSHSWRAETRDSQDTRIEIIRAGRRETIDLGLNGWASPVFDTGYVRLWDRTRRQFVFRCLEGKPDFWVPQRPPAHRGEAELANASEYQAAGAGGAP
ncbi:MAG: hypothetical protein ACYTFD_16960 [Planctomycetota bacterium]|jgi:hypothetical protein